MEIIVLLIVIGAIAALAPHFGRDSRDYAASYPAGYSPSYSDSNSDRTRSN